MIRYLCRIMSLSNLGCGNVGGQVATMMILLMVVILVFIMVTANIGNLGITVTNLANAADKASLSIASQLATRSRLVVKSLCKGSGTQDPCKKCKSRGWGGIIGGIIGAIVMIVLLVPSGGASLFSAGWFAAAASHAAITIGAGALGGTIGGAIGGAIWGPGPLQGALQGFGVGIAIGGAVVSAGSFMSNPVWTWNGTTQSMVISDLALKPLYIAMPTLGAMIGVGSIAATAGATIYNAYVQDKITQAAFAEVVKAFSGLTEQVAIREGAFFDVLTATVDDPNMEQDIYDTDADGDKEEYVPRFLNWWFERLGGVNRRASTVQAAITTFIGKLMDFRNKMNVQLGSGGNLSRREMTTGPDGTLVELVRALRAGGYPVSFWEPGTPDPFCVAMDMGDCEDRSIHDDLDQVTGNILTGTNSADVMNKLLDEGGIDQMAEEWQEWITIFYDESAAATASPEEKGYYYVLEDMIDSGGDIYGIDGWIEELEALRPTLKDCHTMIDIDTRPEPQYVNMQCEGDAYLDDPVCNAPCKIYDGADVVGTIDALLDDPDEFDDAIRDLTDPNIPGTIPVMRALQQAILDLYNALDAAAVKPEEVIPKGEVGGNPNAIIYEWEEEDARGNVHKHSVQVEVVFNMPRLDKTKSSSKICMVVKDWIGSPRVKVTRNDPRNVEVGILGRWNPFGQAVTRTSISHYDNKKIPSSVRLSGIR